jgi:hypothetical protein
MGKRKKSINRRFLYIKGNIMDIIRSKYVFHRIGLEEGKCFIRFLKHCFRSVFKTIFSLIHPFTNDLLFVRIEVHNKEKGAFPLPYSF